MEILGILVIIAICYGYWKYTQKQDEIKKYPETGRIQSSPTNDIPSTSPDNDVSSTSFERNIASIFGIDYTDDFDNTKYIGKNDLYDRIHNKLSEKGSEKDLLIWFTYRVYRKIINYKHSDVKPNDQRFKEIAEELLHDQKVLNSIRRYYGDDLIFFGVKTLPDGQYIEGGSMKTIAYKEVSKRIREKFNINKNK